MRMKLDFDTILPFLCVGFIAGVISTLLPLAETVLFAIGIGALAGSIMRYSRAQCRADR